ncbi:type IV secretory system conjugative DNA transfer family protein [Lysinibacillus xylanilyticus]|uniref:type IV secretory system conjugative DNA transfer family protein n=1 Tax=Lysinibacillus xylanilyticus TaxID=582475 RepID=UPI002B24C5C6|nr:type IV secretory system conjugative DNA transfer family protein [Lysinibacillus xylanilyticus]MEB2301625.1 type IV secretory system conjugative DNA transfer family protein [Lysinibacillus xylanilyticus]
MLWSSIKGTDSFLSGQMRTISLISVFLIIIPMVICYLLSSRVEQYRNRLKYSKAPKARLFSFWITALVIVGVVTWYGLSRAYLYIIPLLEMLIANGQTLAIDGVIETVLVDMAISQRDIFYFLIMCIPLAFVGFILFFFLTKFHIHELEIKNAFYKFSWTGKWMQRFDWLQETGYYPHIILGPDAETGESVRLFGMDRTLNTVIVGAIGTGKSAALGLPVLYTDFDHMIKFIDEYEYNFQNENFWSEEISGQYLNGITVIDPSNDLCKSVYQIAKAHNIPKEAITYIDPTNPDTPSFNPMRGPVHKVAEVFTEVISGLSNKDGGTDYFAQAQRTHLKQYIYLLKEHDPTIDVTFDMLLEMYSNPAVTREKHLKLKTRMPEKIERQYFDTRDEYNYWRIIKTVDSWFNKTLVQKRDRMGHLELNEKNETIFIDAEEEHVKGLRNTLDDIGTNPLLSRVLLGTSDFDFDRHLEIGGVLLVNTAKGELSALSKVLGKIVLMNLQNAVFRREPKVSPYHHILIDESPEYLYPQFKEFPAQSRKYKAILTILMQTLSQLEDEFGVTFKDILLASMRQKMFYGDATGKDAKAFSEIAGEKMVYKEGESEMETSAIQEDPSSRTNASYQKQLEAVMSSNKLIYQEAFACAVKLTDNNTPLPLRIVRANFVPKPLMKKAKVLTTDHAMNFWIEKRSEFGVKYATSFEEIESIEETEEKRKEILDELDLLTEEDRKALEREQYLQEAKPVQYNTTPENTTEEGTEGNGESNEVSDKEQVEMDEQPNEQSHTSLSAQDPLIPIEPLHEVTPIKSSEDVSQPLEQELQTPFTSDFDPFAVLKPHTDEAVVYKESVPSIQDEEEIKTIFK